MMLDAYVQNLARERRYGPNRGPDTQKERDAAQVNLERVIQDYRKRFTGFQPAEPEAYQKEIGRVDVYKRQKENILHESYQHWKAAK